MFIMNKLDTETRVRIVAALIEGVGVNATSRMTGVAKNTILKLLAELGVLAGADRIETLVGKERFQSVASSGGKFLLTNMNAKNPPATLPTAPRQTVASSFALPGPRNDAPD